MKLQLEQQRLHRECEGTQKDNLLAGVPASSTLKQKNVFPVVLHINDCPSFCQRFIKCFIKVANRRFAIVGPSAVSVRVVNKQCEPLALPGSSPLQHLQVAIRVAESGNWATADAQSEKE